MSGEMWDQHVARRVTGGSTRRHTIIPFSSTDPWAIHALKINYSHPHVHVLLNNIHWAGGLSFHDKWEYFQKDLPYAGNQVRSKFSPRS